MRYAGGASIELDDPRDAASTAERVLVRVDVVA